MVALTRWRRPLGIVAMLGLLAALAGAGCGKSEQSTPIRYETAPVERAAMTAKVSASGTLSALVTVQVGSQVSGRLLTIQADFNDRVKKGQVLATIDAQIFRATVEMARANKAAAEGNLVKARVQELDAQRQYQRTQDLFDKGIATQADLDTGEAGYKAASAQTTALQGQLEQAKAGLNQAEVNLEYTTIVSPINGVVISRNVDIGQTVAASLQAPTLFLIAEDMRKMQVDTSVAEADVGGLKEGMQATFTVDAYPNERFSGVIRQIRNAATTVQNVVTYDAVIDVENPNLKFRPGMTANVTIVTAHRDSTLRIPNAALRFRPPPGALSGDAGKADGKGRPGTARASTGAAAVPATEPRPGLANQRTVWVLKDNRPQPVTIGVGITDGTYTEVVEGPLNAGDLVIINAIGTGNAAPRFRVL
jgi:HlyD family secretion protein